jgi:ATP-dependent DNA ligase
MPGFEFCLPTTGKAVPAGPDWLHEVKYDGYRLRIERDGDRVRLFTRNGYDRTGRYPWIVEAARKTRQRRFVLDGEAVILGVDGVSDFETLYSCKCDDHRISKTSIGATFRGIHHRDPSRDEISCPFDNRCGFGDYCDSALATGSEIMA